MPPTALTAVEREIVRLTNALRADPDGALKRQKPMPACAATDDYIEIDPGSGHPISVAALTVDLGVSVGMARDWAVKMSDAGEMSHRPSGERQAVLRDLGVNYWIEGENVAWAQGYPIDTIAQVFFEGWRESDSGHYCAMISSAFTHVGVGHFQGGGKDWGTQNFYGLQ